eukprot:s438_g31.t3
MHIGLNCGGFWTWQSFSIQKNMQKHPTHFGVQSTEHGNFLCLVFGATTSCKSPYDPYIMAAVRVTVPLHGSCAPILPQEKASFGTKTLRPNGQNGHGQKQSATHGMNAIACSVLGMVCLQQRKSSRGHRLMRRQMAKSTLEAPPQKVKQQISQVTLPDTTIVASVEEAEKVMAKLLSLKEAGRFHAIDTEVRGWEPTLSPYLHGEVICWSIYCGDDVDFGNGPRIFIDNMDEDGKLRGLVEYFKPYLEDPDIPKVFQNFSFDRAMLLKHNCDIAGFAGDTMDMAHLDNSEAVEGYSLEALGKRYLGNCWGKRDLKQFMKQEGVKGVAELHLHKDPKVRSQWINYSTFDTLVTWKVHEELRRRLLLSKIRQIPSAGVNEGDAKVKTGKTRKTGNLLDFYDKFWCPYAEVLSRIEERGVRIDRDLLSEKLKDAEAEFFEAREAFLQYVFQVWERLYPEHKDLHETREIFNPNSVVQMRQLLYGRGVQETAGQAVGGLELPPVKVAHVEESTSNEAILKLAGQNPAAGKSGCGEAFKQIGQEGCLGLSQRNEESKIGKAISFMTKLTDDRIADGDSRVHTSLRLSTRTGRLTSQNPNLQQLPAVEKDHYQIRSSVIPAPGKCFVIADYGQLDLRVLAHTAVCPDLIRALSTGTDLHSHTAAQMYPHLQKAIDAGEISLEGGDERPSLKDIYPGERRAAKAVNFGIAYGLTAQGLAKQLNCSQEEADVMIKKWNDAYPQDANLLHNLIGWRFARWQIGNGKTSQQLRWEILQFALIAEGLGTCLICPRSHVNQRRLRGRGLKERERHGSQGTSGLRRLKRKSRGSATTMPRGDRQVTRPCRADQQIWWQRPWSRPKGIRN